MKTNLAALAVAISIAGCGGGGSLAGGDDLPKAPDQIQALSVWRSTLSADRTYVTRGNGSDGATYEITTTIRPKGSAQLGLEPPSPLVGYGVVEMGTTVKRNNVAYSSSSLLLHLVPSTSVVGAMVDPKGTATGATCMVPGASDQTPPIPVTANLGATGRIFNGGTFNFNSGNSRCITSSAVFGAPTHGLSWSYEEEKGRPLFCINYNTRYPGLVQRDQNSCFEVIQGASTGGAARVSLSSGALSLVTNNY